MKDLKKVNKKLHIFIIIIGVFIITHIAPSIFIRTHLFIFGHPIGAFRGTVEINEPQYKLDKVMLDDENAMIYTIRGCNLFYHITGNSMINYKVKKIGFLYFTEAYGIG